MNQATLYQYPVGFSWQQAVFKSIDRLARVANTVDRWNRRHKTRRQFTRVNAHTLRDIGFSAADRFIEVNKPFWEE
ncbi:MAG: DUF1127 domain-containing protein [Gammaproteobacteria bacterium]|nr:DUF1127 domain-containing protein [Gammaproteobacteria bacterium]MCP4981847.1 DUF1127 domain-containing protein [Gammaproteobacteria bacterium]